MSIIDLSIPAQSLIQCADQALALLANEYGLVLPKVTGADLLFERSARLALSPPTQRDGVSTSANGSCRLLPVANGWLAINLAREEDWSLLSAWLTRAQREWTWQTLAAALVNGNGEQLLERGRVMGLPIAYLRSEPSVRPQQPWYRFHNSRPMPAFVGGNKIYAEAAPLVVDMSSLWAGPLCSHLLRRIGMRVIKVESTHRPDGARAGTPEFFELLNADKEHRQIDFKSTAGISALKALIERADIVIEGSRPRALLQLGIDASAILAADPDKLWLSITAYGLSNEAAEWVGFGDDVAIAAGAYTNLDDNPGFYGDAVADPLTGIYAALAGAYFYRELIQRHNSGGRIDVSLYSVAAHCVNRCASANSASLNSDWPQAMMRSSGPVCTAKD